MEVCRVSRAIRTGLVLGHGNLKAGEVKTAVTRLATAVLDIRSDRNRSPG
jgi:hypothetical protein